MRRTRKWGFVRQEAIRLAGLRLSSLEIAKRLGVTKATVNRWKAEGKLPAPSTRRRQPGTTTGRRPLSPAGWAAAVRREYALDATDGQLVNLAQIALEISRNPKEPHRVRMAATGRFQSIVKQLALVARDEDKAAGDPVPDAVETPTRNPAVARKSGGDPRGILMAVNTEPA